MEYYFLGICKELSSPRGKFKFQDFLLLAETDGNSIIAIPNEGSSSNVRVSRRSISDYFKFNGKQYRNIFETVVNFDDLELFGKATSVLYESDKVNGGGTGHWELFRHKFGATVYLWKSPENDLFVVSGKNLTVTEAGIEH